MRWLGHVFQDLADLKRQYPSCSSWTAFKVLLPSLKPPSNGQASSGKAKSVERSQRGVAHRGLLRSAKSLRERIHELREREAHDLDAKLRSELRDLFEEVKALLDETSGTSPQA